MRARVQGELPRRDVIGWRSGQCEGRRLHIYLPGRGNEQEGIKNQLFLHDQSKRCIGGHGRESNVSWNILCPVLEGTLLLSTPQNLDFIL